MHKRGIAPLTLGLLVVALAGFALISLISYSYLSSTDGEDTSSNTSAISNPSRVTPLPSSNNSRGGAFTGGGSSSSSSSGGSSSGGSGGGSSSSGSSGGPAPQCSDGLDNDGDGFIDYPADTGCVDASDTDESDFGTGSNLPPSALFTLTPSSGSVPLSVTFNGSLSSDPEGLPLNYSWWWTNGTSILTSTLNTSFSYVFTQAGTFTVNLTVTDAAGSSSSNQTSLIVSAVCGDGIIHQGEQCDGSNLGGNTCPTAFPSAGYTGGTLSCNACSFVSTGCTTTAPDSTPPQFSNIVATPSVYTSGQSTLVNVTVTDNIAVDRVTLTFNGQVYANPTSLGGNRYSQNVGQRAAGTYSYSWSANDTSNNVGASGAQSYVLAQATPALIGSSSAGTLFTYGTSSRFTGVGCPIGGAGGIQCKLYINNVEIANGTSLILGTGNPTFMFNSTGNQNYTSQTHSQVLTIRPASTICTLSVTSNPVTYPSTTALSANCTNPEAITRLYRNGIDVTSTNGLAVQLGGGSYSYLANVSASQNYTTNQSNTINLVVNKANPSLSLSISPSSSVPFGTQTTVTGSGCTAPLLCTLIRNGISVTSPDVQTLAVGSYVYNYSTNGNQNYTSAFSAQNLNVGLTSYSLSVSKMNSGSGTITSTPVGINCGATCSNVFTQNQQVNLTATPLTGSTFAGWSGAGCSGTTLTCQINMTSNQSISANFALQQFSVSVTKSGTGSGTVTSLPVGINCGATCSASYNYSTLVTLTPTAQPGSTFTGWSGACSGTGTCQVNVTQALSVTAAFTSIVFSLSVSNSAPSLGTITSNVGNINCGATCLNTTLPQGTSVTLTATPTVGATFTGWSGACSGTTLTCQINMTSNQSISASFVSQTFNLAVTNNQPLLGSVTSNPASINCGATCSASYTYGTPVTLTANAVSGANLTSWTGACSGTGTCQVTMTSNQSVGANFALQQFLVNVSLVGTGTGMVTSNPAGINCSSSCSAPFVYSTLVTLTPTAQPGSTFTGWSGACSGTGLCNVNTTQARSVTATFTATLVFTLTVTKSGTGGGLVTSNVSGINCGAICSNSTIPQGNSILLTATPNASSTFVGWSGAGCSGTGTCQVTMSSSQSVTAQFNAVGAPLSIAFVVPTPANGASQSAQSFTINTSSMSSGQHYAFLDFNGDAALWMRMDDLVTGQPQDLSSWTNGGTLAGNTLFGSGRFGNAAWFDGAGDSISIPADPSLDLPTIYTVSLWFYLNQLPVDQQIMQLLDAGDKHNLDVLGSGTNAFLNSWDGTELGGVTALQATRWYHAVLVRDTTGHRLYLNGVLESSDTSLAAITAGASTHTIGRHPTFGRDLNGRVDEVLIFGRALAAQEVRALYNASASTSQLASSFVSVPFGAYSYQAHAVDTSANRADTEVRSLTLQSAPDSTPPQFSNIVATPSVYTFGQVTVVNVTVTDNVGVSSVNLTFNGQTYLNPTKNGNVYSQNLGPRAAGTYSYSWGANDTSSNRNTTTAQSYVLVQASPSLTVQSSSGSNFGYGTATTITVSGCPTQGAGGVTCRLYRNGVDVTGTIGQAVTLGAGAYTFTYNSTGSQNYTSASQSIGVTVSRAASSVSLSLLPSSSVIQGTQTTATGTCQSGLTCVLTRNGVDVTSPDVQTLAVGSYVYNYSTNGNTNYSASSQTQTLTVSSVPVFTLTVAKSGTGGGLVTSNVGGINCGTICSNSTMPQGQVVILTASANASSTFAGWTGACSGTSSCNLVMTANQNVGAQFSSTGAPPATVGLCEVSGATMQNYALPSAQASTFTFYVNITPQGSGMSSVIMLSDQVMATYTDAAVLVRFNPTDTIDARNGPGYAAVTSISYTPGVSYIFRLVVNPATDTYDVFVTPSGGVEQTVALGYSFRDSHPTVTQFTHFAMSTDVGTGATVCDPRVGSITFNVCGNTQIEFGEVCDGSSNACTLGGYSGTASCNAQCTALNSCNIGTQACGDGIINGPEQCDGSQLGGQSCTGLGYTSGSLSCSASCVFNTLACTGPAQAACANNVDDDGDGLVDLDDPGCMDASDASEVHTGTVYYVCNTGGSNANAGTSKNAPWATFDYAKSRFLSLQAGDAILFCKGGSFTSSGGEPSEWRNTNCQGSNPCTIGSYTPQSGATTKPLITSTYSGGNDQAAMFNFNQYGQSASLSGFSIRNLRLVDGGATAFAVYVGTGGGGSAVVSNITLEGLTMEQFNVAVNTQTPHYQGPVSPQAKSIKIRNSLIQNNINQGWLGASENGLIENTTFLNNGDYNSGGRDHNIYLDGGSDVGPIRFMTVRNNYLRGAASSGGVCNAVELVAHGYLLNLLIENNTIEDTQALGSCYGIELKDNGEPETPTSQYPEPYPDERFDYGIIRGNVIKGVGNVGINVAGCSGCVVENNALFAYNNGNPDSSNVLGVRIESGKVPNQNITVRHNSFLFDRSAIRGIDYNSITGTSNGVYGNAIYYKGTDGAFSCFVSGAGASTYQTFNYNNCYAPNLGSLQWMNSQSLSAWQGSSGKDTNSFVGDPQFTSVNSPYNLLPQASSPLIDVVPVNLLPTRDIRGMTRPLGVLGDVGAYEVQAPGVGGSSGWTNFAPSPDSRIIYVSSSTGNDANDGLSEATPKKTLSAGVRLLRNGYPDHLRLKRGDIWLYESFRDTLSGLDWSLSGRSLTEPLVIEAYGPESDPRPLIVTGRDSVFVRDAGRAVNYVALMNFEAWPGRENVDELLVNGIDGNRSGGISIVGTNYQQPVSNLFFEDLYLHHYTNNINIIDNSVLGTASSIRNITIRRCIISNSFSNNSHSQGFFLAGIAGNLVLEENIVDANGFAPGFTTSDLAPNHFNHNFYIYDYDGADWPSQLTTLRGNIIARASHSGAQMRGGGVAYNNLFVENPASLQCGTAGLNGGNGFDPTRPYTCDYNYNVISESSDGPDAFGSGIVVDWIRGGGVIANNLISNTKGSSAFWINLEFPAPSRNPPVENIIRNLDIHDNVAYNGGQGEFQGDLTRLYNVTLRNNVVQNTNPNHDLMYYYTSYTTPQIGQYNSSNNLFYSPNARPFNYFGGAHTLAEWRSAIGDTSSVIQQVSFPDPSRTLASYNSQVLGRAASVDDFMTEAKKQRRGRWDVRYTAPEVNNWIREGFGMVQLSPPPGGGNRPSGDTFVASSGGGANDAGTESVNSAKPSLIEQLISFLKSLFSGTLVSDANLGITGNVIKQNSLNASQTY